MQKAQNMQKALRTAHVKSTSHTQQAHRMSNTQCPISNYFDDEFFQLIFPRFSFCWEESKEWESNPGADRDKRRSIPLRHGKTI